MPLPFVSTCCAWAEHAEAELGEELHSFINGCPGQWQELPIPEGRIVVCLDGGYVRNWYDRKSNFELIVGHSLPEDRAPCYLGLVHGYDRKPQRRLFELLKHQGLQANQEVAFLTDGGEEVHALTEQITPASEHVLAWFHLTMRLTVLGQFAWGMAHDDERQSAAFLKSLESIKWLLWHGNFVRAVDAVRRVTEDSDDLEFDYPQLRKFARVAHEFCFYIESNLDILSIMASATARANRFLHTSRNPW